MKEKLILFVLLAPLLVGLQGCPRKIEQFLPLTNESKETTLHRKTVGEEESDWIQRTFVAPYVKKRYGDDYVVKALTQYASVYFFLAYPKEGPQKDTLITIAATTHEVLGDSKTNGLGKTLKFLRFHETHYPSGRELLDLCALFYGPKNVLVEEPPPEFRELPDGSYQISFWKRMEALSGDPGKLTLRIHPDYRVEVQAKEPPQGEKSCLEVARRAGERVLRSEASNRRNAIWLELSREELHCGALPDPHFLKFAFLLDGLTLEGMQQSLRRWLEGTQTKTLDQICPGGKKKLDESLRHPLRDGGTLHLIALCHSFVEEWRIFKEVDPVTFLAVQIIYHHWKVKGILTEEHKNLLKLLLHDVSHEIEANQKSITQS